MFLESLVLDLTFSHNEETKLSIALPSVKKPFLLRLRAGNFKKLKSR